MVAVGYQYVFEQLRLPVLAPVRPASVRAVTRIEHLENAIAVPAAMHPGPGLLEHLLFALKHEGTDLALLAAACPHLEPDLLLHALQLAPQGQYIRKLCYIWEHITGNELASLPVKSGGAPVLLFDPDRYLTARPQPRDPRWRVCFNGLGDWSFCPSVRRTEPLMAALATEPLAAAREFLATLPAEQIERVLAWAYLHETRSSYAIEGEAPSGNRSEAFAALLRRAHERHAIDEAHFVELQNAAMSSPYAREVSFRTLQNYLSDGTPGARGVTYVPPPSPLLPSLIEGIARLANLETAEAIDPLVRAALVSFGFVFAHPFLDGNGRLSRYLAHYALCQAKALPNGAILPLSTAMKRNEKDYLHALQSFSAPVRTLWDVRWLDAEEYTFNFRGHEAIYRFWDATECVVFLHHMAGEALRQDLRDEVAFLHCYDALVREVNARYDIVGSVLSKLIVMAYYNGGTLSLNRRKQLSAQVDPQAMDFIEERMRAHLAEPPLPAN